MAIDKSITLRSLPQGSLHNQKPSRLGKFMKKWLLVILFSGLFFLFISTLFETSFAQTKIEVSFFYSLTCPHCAQEKIFLEKLPSKYPQVEIKYLEFGQKENQSLLEKYYHDYQVPAQEKGLVPITFIGEKYFLGFRDEQTSGAQIEEYLKQMTAGDGTESKVDKEATTPLSDTIKLPIIGEIEISKFSLPALAVILGFFDGFNVCSLGALILILGIVLAFRSRKKTLILGSIFILTTAIVYGILIFIWHQVFLSLSPYLRKMEFFIGILALVGGGYFLWQFFKIKKRGPVCEFGGISQKLSAKIQKVFQQKTGILALIGAVFAFATTITIIEFPCSAVLPVLFASILSQAHLSVYLSLLYIAIFLFFYMLDEIIIFLIAFWTMRVWIASAKFVTWLNLIAALMLFLLGAYYLLGIV